MKAIVDHSLCEGHAKCMDKVPEVFEVREDDRSYIVLDEIPEELRARVERAVQVCPRAAISLKERVRRRWVVFSIRADEG